MKELRVSKTNVITVACESMEEVIELVKRIVGDTEQQVTGPGPMRYRDRNQRDQRGITKACATYPHLNGTYTTGEGQVIVKDGLPHVTESQGPMTRLERVSWAFAVRSLFDLPDNYGSGINCAVMFERMVRNGELVRD